MEFWFSEMHTPHVKLSIRVDRQLYSGKSEFQRIDVFDSPEFGRFLTLDGYIDVYKRQAFSQRFEEAFGPDARLAPQNLVDKRKLEVRTPDVKIQVDPQRGDLVETRIIDGVGYVLIRAEGGVEVNGVPVRFSQED